MHRWTVASTGCCLSLLLSLFTTSAAFAMREPDTVYDARTVGMAGAASAVGSPAASVFYNTALISKVDKRELSLTVTPVMPQLTAPWPDPATGQLENRKSDRALAPLPNLAFFYRLHDRLVVGAAALAAGGTGMKYSKVPAFGGKDAAISGMLLEFQVPVAVQLLSNLQVGVAYRLVFGRGTIDIPTLADPTNPAAGFVEPSTVLTALQPAATQAGIHWQATSNLDFGFSYRQGVSLELKGDTKVNGAVVAKNVTTTLSEPHRFMLGGAVNLLDKRLVLAGEVGYWMYARAFKKSLAEGRAADWKDGMKYGVGSEFFVIPRVPVRLGYSLNRMAITDGAVSAFESPPGFRHTVTAGAGVKLTENWDLDAALSYGFVPTRVIAGGEYRLTTYAASLTTAYRF